MLVLRSGWVPAMAMLLVSGSAMATVSGWAIAMGDGLGDSDGRWRSAMVSGLALAMAMLGAGVGVGGRGLVLRTWCWCRGRGVLSRIWVLVLRSGWVPAMAML